MTDSTFAPSAEQRARLLRVMQRQADGKLAPSAHDLPATSEWDAAGHGSYGTIQDYGRFVQAWLNDGAGVLKPATAQMALQNHIGSIKLPELMKSTVPELSNDVPGTAGAAGLGPGLPPDAGRPAGHAQPAAPATGPASSTPTTGSTARRASAAC